MDGQPIAVAAIDPASAGVVGALALLYFRHGDAPRALALGLAAMRLGPPEPRLVLLVAATFLKVGDPVQAIGALERLGSGPPLVSAAPSPAERGAALVLRAKALHRQGEAGAARAALEQGRALLAAEPNPLGSRDAKRQDGTAP